VHACDKSDEPTRSRHTGSVRMTGHRSDQDASRLTPRLGHTTSEAVSEPPAVREIMRLALGGGGGGANGHGAWRGHRVALVPYFSILFIQQILDTYPPRPALLEGGTHLSHRITART